MSLYDEKLKAIRELLDRGVVPPKETVRSFLQWFSAERRGLNVVSRIRRALQKYGLETTPDFDSQYIDGLIGFSFVKADEGSAKNTEADTPNDPSYRLGRLASANRTPISVKPDASLQHAITLMLTNDFSQLPVMTTPRDVKGVISWKSIGSRLALKLPCSSVRESMDSPIVASLEDSLFSALDIVAAHDYILTQAADKTICGIVTASDFNDQFLKLAEPFLLVGEIENGVRQMLHGKFAVKDLEEAKAPGDDGRSVTAVTDLSFGEYIRLIEQDKRWQKLGLQIDRVEFVARLNKIREVRNDVMHFDPDGLEPSDMSALREFARFLRTLRDLGAL